MTITIPLGWSFYQEHMLALPLYPNILLYGDRESEHTAHIQKIVEYLDLYYLSRFKIFIFDNDHTYDETSKKIVRFNSLSQLKGIIKEFNPDIETIIIINHLEDLFIKDKCNNKIIADIKKNPKWYLIASASNISIDAINQFKTLLCYKLSDKSQAKELIGSALPIKLEPRQFIYGKSHEIFVIDKDKQSFNINYDNAARYDKLNRNTYREDLKKELDPEFYKTLNKYGLIEQYLHMFLYRCDQSINFKDILYFLKKYELCGYIRQKIKNLDEIKIHSLNNKKINIIYMTITKNETMKFSDYEPFENYLKKKFGPFTETYVYHNYGKELVEDETYVEAFLFTEERSELFTSDRESNIDPFLLMDTGDISHDILIKVMSDYYIQGIVSKEHLMNKYNISEKEAQGIKDYMEVK